MNNIRSKERGKLKTVDGYNPVVELTRGGIVECVHFGALAMVDSDGKLLFSLGDSGLVTFPRSSMKPFQALPFVEFGGQEAFGLTDEEISIMCASHHGTDEHVRVLKSIHQKAKLNEGMLQCGVHWPGDKNTVAEMRERGEMPTSFRHNCSGKHSGMLAHARLRELPVENYLDLTHPVQEIIRTTVAEMCSVNTNSLIPGTDGCSAPVYAMPLERFALGVARLCDPRELPSTKQIACQKITQAMITYPVMVSGPTGFDTALMKVMAGKAVVKGGAEGYQMIGLMPDALHPGSKGVGIAFKISDGDASRRATYCLSVALLKALGFEKEMQLEDISEFNTSKLKNWRGLEVGEIRVCHPIRIGI